MKRIHEMNRSTRIVMGSILAVAIVTFGLLGPNGILKDIAHAQTRTNARSLDKQGKYISEIGAQVYWSPADLNMNAITLPASAATANSLIVDTKGAKEVVIWGACNQVASLTVNVLDIDATTVLISQSVATAIPTTGGEFAMGNESPSNVVGGTAVAGAAGLRTPAPFVSFSFTNSGATPGTCTARLIAQY